MTGNRDALARCLFCDLELDSCLCAPLPSDVGDGRRTRLSRAELDHVEAAELRLAVLERRGGARGR
jgi:hypothetical protein